MSRITLSIATFLLCFSGALQASNPMEEHEVKNVRKVALQSDSDRQRLQKTAGFLGYYEIEAKKLLGLLDDPASSSEAVNEKSQELISLSENVIDSANFRLPQCREYLDKTMLLKDRLASISHEELEKDYHLDGALPTAPAECYHTKDLFVHPATALILVRDDPGLSADTRKSINAEISEVLTHLELVRQLVVYE